MADKQEGAQAGTHRARTGEVPRPRSSGGKSPGPSSLAHAIEWIDSHGATLGPEEIDLDEAGGRVIASDIPAPMPVPQFDRAAADGFAVRAGETVGAGDYNPLPLALVEPGSELPISSAAPVVAGAPLPQGADAVLPLDLGQAKGAMLEIFGAVPQGWGIVRRGQQLTAGASLLEAERVLLPQDIGLLASFGIRRVPVVRQPRVRLLVYPPKPAESTRDAGAQGDANSPMLRALVARDGGIVVEASISESGPGEALSGKSSQSKSLSGTSLSGTLARALATGDADLILIAGRSGHGRDDDAARAIAEAGELSMHGLALRPGGSAGIGLVGSGPVLLLPGDPLDCWSAYEMLAGRLVRRLGGRSPELPYAVLGAEVGHKIVSAIGVVELCRVRLVQGRVEPVGLVESGGLTSAVRADGFVLVPAPREGFAPGIRVDVFLFPVSGSGTSG